MTYSTRSRKRTPDLANEPTLAQPESADISQGFGVAEIDRTGAEAAPQQDSQQAVPTLRHSFGSVPLRAGGGVGVAAAPGTPPVQAKLTVNTPGDAFEQEADRVAEEVMRDPEEPTTEQPSAGAATGGKLQRSGGAEAGPVAEERIASMQSGGGAPLPASEQAFFERKMGHDFSKIRIHSDQNAADASKDLSARAFTVGNSIAFAPGEYQPGSAEGRKLLAHELTHTIQQTGGVATKRIQRKTPDHAGETAAPAAEQPAPGQPAAEGSAQAAEGAAQAQGNPPGAEVKAKADTSRRTSPAAEEAGAGEPLAQSVQKAAEGGPRQALQEQAQKLGGQMLSADAKQPAADAKQPAADAKQPAPAQDGMAEAQAAQVQAGEKAAAAGAELASAQEATAKLAGQPAELAPLDIESVMKQAGLKPKRHDADGPDASVFRKESGPPPSDGTGDEQEVDPAELQAQIEQMRSQCQGMVSGFMANATGRVQGALALGQTAAAQIQGPVASAQATIQAGVQEQCAVLSAQFAQARAQAQSAAATNRAQVEAKYAASVASIQANLTKTTQQIDTRYQQSMQRVQQLEQTQVQVLNQSYAKADKDYRATGVQVGQEAVGIGNQMAAEYLSHKINRDDSLLDGDLTDRRCEARAKAAREVSSQYQPGLVDAANKQADEAQKGKPRDLSTLSGIKTQALTTLQQQQQALLQQARAAADAAKQQAMQAKTQFLQSITQSLSSTMQTLQSQEASQLQGLRSMGQQQSMAIGQAGQGIIAGLQRSVKQAVGGLQESIGGVSGALAGVQVPDPEAVGNKLAEAMGQIDSGIASLQAQVQQSVANAQQQLTQQSAQVVQGLATAAQQGAAAATQLVAQMTSGLTQLQSGAQNAFGEIEKSFTTQSSQIQKSAADGFDQVLKGTEQSFQQVNQNISTAFAQATPALQEGLRGALNDMRAKIREEADKAADQEQPRWKGILKIVLIIAVIVVVALVVGPFVIGAVGAAAGALGASAAAAGAIGAIVGGAIVGAGSSAVIQMGNNLIDGKPLMEGVVQAAIVGAIGGALGGVGGLAGDALAGTLTSTFGKAALKFGVDMVADTVGNVLGSLATGQPITLGDLVSGLAMSGGMSLITNGLTKMGKFGKGIEGIQQRSMGTGDSVGSAIGAKVGAAMDISVPKVSTPQVDAPSAAPHVDAPKVDAPPAPQVDAPKVDTPAPHAETPKVDAPKVDAPPAPQVDAPKVDTPAPQAAAPQVDAPKVDAPAPHVETPKVDAPKVDAPPAPQVDAPKVDTPAPHNETPQVDAPKVDAPPAPQVDAPKVDTPATHAETPKVDAPKADTPTAPKTDTPAPHTEAPKADAPKTDSPAPKVEEPEATAPKLDEPSSSTHYDQPEIEPGVVAKQELDGGHQVKVLKDGRIIRCSTCSEIRTQYAAELLADPKLRTELDAIAKIADPTAKAKASAELAARLEAVRVEATSNGTPAGIDPKAAVAAQQAGLPAAPEGYYWYKDGGQLIVKRNPGQGDSLVPLRYDADSPSQFMPDVTPPKDYQWKPQQKNGKYEYTLEPTKQGMPSITYDPKTKRWIDANSGKDYVAPELAGGDWADHSYNSSDVKPCFVPGTLVHTPNGSCPIESLRVGDLVYTYDFTQKTVVKRLILKLYQGHTEHLVDVQVGNDIITATRMHPFWVESAQEWLPAAQLETGMLIRLLDGTIGVVKSARVYPAVSTTYNLEVEETHNYFVGGDGVLVHNGSDDDLSNFASTEKANAYIYIIKCVQADGSEVTIYVGKTIQDPDTRYQQHLDESLKDSSYKRIDGKPWGDPEVKARLSVDRVPLGERTAYEIAIWELYYINKEKAQFEAHMQNQIAPITEDNYNEFKSMHNPCL
ncbi:DUF4157 domain-containing protein [Chloroflexia bacterium SDU3-3]|nr:DUF4157 domain-containing protein [Chloroflexia bacterium SDU3-3]